MATERLSMRNTREILRQKWTLGRSHREVGQSVGVSIGAVSAVIARATAAGLDWLAVTALADDALEAKLYPSVAASSERPLPDCAYIHAERRKPGVTLELLHLEYLEKHPNGFRYTQFCERYREWLGRRRLSMRQEHRAGEKLFVDYSGKKPRIVDPKTGELTKVELFVAVLGASNYTFAEATLTQRGPDFIASHVRALAFLGGVPAALVPDQLKSGVIAACRYEPGIQRTYEDLAQHYATAILPARPGHPRDKAKVEAGVLVAQRWILARLRHETFFSLDALNERIGDLLEELNDRRMRVYGASRRELFERIDRPALKALPSERFEYSEWRKARLNIDYHAEVDHHFYSAPHALVHEQLDVRLTAITVELFHRGERVASHLRSYRRGGHTTIAEHMPKAHRAHSEWSPSRIIEWAGSIGPSTKALAEAILAERRHPEQGYRSCLGILRLARGRVRARVRRPGSVVSARRVDPEEQPRSHPVAGEGAAGGPTRRPREHPRRPLLQLRGEAC
jgi:transposase